jgi:hypothetical protein
MSAIVNKSDKLPLFPCASIAFPPFQLAATCVPPILIVDRNLRFVFETAIRQKTISPAMKLFLKPPIDAAI